VANGAYVGCDPPDLGPMSSAPGAECRDVVSSCFTAALTSGSTPLSDAAKGSHTPDGANGLDVASNEQTSSEYCAIDVPSKANVGDVELAGKREERDHVQKPAKVVSDLQKSQNTSLMSATVTGLAVAGTELQLSVEDHPAALSAGNVQNVSSDENQDSVTQQINKLRLTSQVADTNCLSGQTCDDNHSDFAASPFDMVPSPVKDAKILPAGLVSNRFLNRLEKNGIPVDSMLTNSEQESALSVQTGPAPMGLVSKQDSLVSDSTRNLERQSSSGDSQHGDTSVVYNEADLEKRIIRQMEVVEYGFFTNYFLAYVLQCATFSKLAFLAAALSVKRSVTFSKFRSLTAALSVMYVSP
jgi:hypothetical protein